MKNHREFSERTREIATRPEAELKQRLFFSFPDIAKKERRKKNYEKPPVSEY